MRQNKSPCPSTDYIRTPSDVNHGLISFVLHRHFFFFLPAGNKKGGAISLAEASVCMCACSNSLWNACIVTQILSPSRRSRVYFYHQLLWQMLKQRQFLKDLIRQKQQQQKKTKPQPRINFRTFHLFWIWCRLPSVAVRGWRWVKQVRVTQSATGVVRELKIRTANVGKVCVCVKSVSFKSLLSFPLHLPSFVIDLEVKREKHPTFTTNTLILS